jgi:intracellular multiplication protein IcmB
MAHFRFINEIKELMAQTFGLDAEAYTSLTTVEDETSFVTKDGGLMSLLPLRGHRQVVGVEELARLTDQLLSLLGSLLAGDERHLVDVVFSSDPARTPEAIQKLLEPGAGTATRIGLDLRDLMTERVRHLPAYTHTEVVYLILWTTPLGLPSSTCRQAARERRREMAQWPTPPELTRDNQDPFACNRYLADPHRSVVKTLVNDLRAAGFDLEVAPVAEACRRLRFEADPDWTPADWRPLLPGTGWPAPRLPPDGEVSAAGCWFPAFGPQLFPRGMEIVDYRTLRVGDRLYQPFFVDLPQLTEMQRFERLLDRVRQQRLPWRLLIRLGGGAGAWLTARRRWTGLLHFAGSTNKLIDASVQALRRYLNEGHVGVTVQMALTSWVSTLEEAPRGHSHREELRARTAYLAAAVQSWGGCTVRQASGNPVKAWVSTLPGMSQLNIATRYAAPLQDVLKTLPLFRPASVWPEGALVYRSRDGRLFPYQPGSAKQGSWNELFFARPGSGKSVAMNAANLALILSPGFRELPFVRIIDIGFSSEGLISLVREALPPARRFEAQFHAPQNEAHWAINPLDTPLGFRCPPPAKRAFLVSFLSLLATAPGTLDSPEGVSDMGGLILDLVYDHYSDAKAPKPYAAAQDRTVDAALERNRLTLPDRPSWWEITDALFDAGDVPAAIRAQRYAVPLLSDLIAVAQWPQIAHLYGGDMRLESTSESPVQLFNRVVSATTREWPLLAYPTRFDLGNARVASLDVAALCGDMTPVGQRQTAIAYLLALHVLSHDLFMDSLTAAIATPRYQTYHGDRAEALLTYPKKFCIDEKHRCGGITAVDAQIVRLMREGRKANVHVALASQILSDFTDDMVELATTIFIMEYTSDERAEVIRAKFSLSAAALAELRTHGTGPTPAGAPFLGVFRTKLGTLAQLLYLTTGPIELWALSTTAEDRVIRQRLYQRFGPRRARTALARAYPGGTAKAELQRRLESHPDGALDRDAVLNTLVEEVAKMAVQLQTGDREQDFFAT